MISESYAIDAVERLTRPLSLAECGVEETPAERRAAREAQLVVNRAFAVMDRVDRMTRRALRPDRVSRHRSLAARRPTPRPRSARVRSCSGPRVSSRKSGDPPGGDPEPAHQAGLDGEANSRHRLIPRGASGSTISTVRKGALVCL